MTRPRAAAGAAGCRSQQQQQQLLLLLLLLLLPALACDVLDEFPSPGFGPANASRLVSDPLAAFGPRESGFYLREGLPSVEDGANGAKPEEGPSRRRRIGRGGGEEEEEKAEEEDGGRREAEGEGRTVARAVGDEYVVRFREYRHASAHREALERALGSRDGWQWVDRHNPAARFPTDFGLLRIQDGRREALLSRLSGIAFVRDVSPQMQFTRQLASDSEPAAGKKGFSSGRRAAKEGSPEEEKKDGTVEDLAPFQEQGKDPGRLRTAMSFGDELLHKWEATNSSGGRSTYGMERSQITSMFEADKLWARGYTGAKVKMAVFDTGIRGDHPHFRNIKERTNWTNEKDILNDNLGHGTFVAGVISSQDPQCLGFAPDAEVYAFRVFTDAQVSYTSWFLDAFNYAIATKMNVLNLSIGGPDYLDSPFVEKVWEMTANNIIMVSAIGNDGPLYGTLNNPADQSDVIGVGGIDYSNHIASFSSRGMSTWELPHGYGRVKPDVVAYGREVIGSKITTGCKSLSGTSVASPVVAGGVCLLASVVPEENRWDILNPASMKQALIEGATQLAGPNMFEQGAGRLNLLNSFEILRNYTPRASIHPGVLDLTDCPYTWPFCRQPLYHGALPVIFNATILNGMGVVGYVEAAPVWTPFTEAGQLLDIQFTFSDVIWPWTGHVGLHIRVKAEGSAFTGTLEGNVSFTVVSPPQRGEKSFRRWDCRLPIKVAVVPTPPRERRILWDQFHSVRYPPGYIPRDSLDVRNDILDWHGDHMHTNFHGMFDSLRDAGYFLETLGSPLTCFDARQYGTLLMVDLEDEYHEEEIRKLSEDVKTHGLGLIVFADWYHLETIVKMRFFDDNTRSWWTPATGGANIPALNDLLSPFDIAFGDTILNGAYSIGTERAHYASGTDIRKFPAGGFVHSFLFQDSSGGNAGITSTRTGVRAQVESPILGVVEAGRGRIAVYGDSNCLDNSHMVTNCYWLLRKLLDYTSFKIRDPLIFASTNELTSPVGARDADLPVRRSDINFSTYSLVLDRELNCGIDAPLEVQGSSGFLARKERSERPFPNLAPLSGSVTQRQSMTSDSADDRESPMSTRFGSALDHHTTGANDLPQFSSDDLDGDVEGTGLNSSERVLIRINSGGISKGDKVGKYSTDLRQNDGIMDLIGGWKTKKESRLSVGRRRGEVDSAGSVFQWLVPVSLCATGFFLFWSLWAVRQKRPKRGKKGSKSVLLTV